MPPSISENNPAGRTIDRFGGISRCARALQKPKSTIQRWKYSGHIHPDYYPEILAAAVAEGVVLDVRDFNVVEVDHPAFNAPTSPPSDDTAGRDPAASADPIPEISQSSAASHGFGDRAAIPASEGVA